MTADRRHRLGVIASVGLAHAGLFALLSLTQAPIRPADPPVFDVELFRPPPLQAPPPPPPPPAETTGGGAPAAPSRIHTPPRPVDQPPELPAPPVQAPEPALVVGVAPVAGPTPGMGQGGEGTGSGTGDGDGPGSGGTGPLILRGPSQAEILTVVPPAARAARRSGRSSINCLIRIDQRLEACRVVDETPAGFGFAEAALRASVFFRFRPPMTGAGRPVEGQRVTVFVQFGRPGG